MNRDLLRNYFRIALRSILKSKGFSAINIGGLALGMAVVILIGLWIYDELNFNKYHRNYGSVGQVLVKSIDNGEGFVNEAMSLPLGMKLHSDYRENFKHIVMSTGSEEHIVSHGERKISQTGRFMEGGAPEMLSLEMKAGSVTGLDEIHTVLISESLAKSLFGDSDPLDELVKIDKQLDAKVTGIYRDLPKNTQFSDVKFIAPLNLFIASKSDDWREKARSAWNNNFLQIYVQLADNTDFRQTSLKVKDLKINNVDKEYALARKPEVFIYPMSKWNLYSKFENGVNVTSDKLRSIYYFGTIGLFVLFLACINFMNLSTARFETRAKEVGVRKAIGSVRQQLMAQFLTESIFTTSLSFFLSILLVLLMLPHFNSIAGKSVAIPAANPMFWVGIIAFCLFTGLLSGSYPALFLSSFQPVKVLKGSVSAGRFALLPRKLLVVIQFSVSIALIIGTLIVFHQMKFVRDRPIGYETNGLIYISMKTDDLHKHHQAFREQLLRTGVVEEMAESNGSINELGSNNNGISWKGKDPGVPLARAFGTIGVSHGFGKTVGWQFSKGRDFSNAGDSSSTIVNEQAVKMMGLKDPIGEMIRRGNMTYTIIGVIKDVLMESPYEPVSPTMFYLQNKDTRTVSIKMKKDVGVSQALAKIEKVFDHYAPGVPFDYRFADGDYGKKFDSIMRISKLVTFFAILAIFISCMGLFGLASFVAEERTKEIGIRKVLGASVTELWQLLSKDFVSLVAASCVIATAIAYYFMGDWLQRYTYRTEMHWWIFAGTCIGAIAITLVTVSYQAVRVALINPVISLKAE